LFKNYKPLHFFSFIAVILAVLSAIFFIPVMSEYLKTGLVPNLPTMIVCGFVMIAAIQSFFSGLILENIIQKNRQDFELQLIRINERYKKISEGEAK
jgi:hypothetical protein